MRPVLLALIPLLAVCLAFALGCDRGPEAAPVESPRPAASATVSLGKAGPISPRWVAVYDPERAWNGYTLTLHEARVPILLDMNGRPVHAWPEARLKSRVRLLPDGSILGIGLGRLVVEYDWEGRQVWEFRTPGAIPHHDVLRLANGNTLVLVLKEGDVADTLYEVDRAGKVVWTWQAAEHLKDRFPEQPSDPDDLTHINSLQELPENPWFAAGDARFRPGNLLVSARNLNAAFIIDRSNGEVVWWFSEGLDAQHEALMNGPGLPEAGKIQIFNNRLHSFSDDRQSEVLEIDPRNGSVDWRYRSAGFFSPTSATQQALPNGNVLITSTRGGRVFEVTRAGETVWEWVPPYQTVRALRIAADACPQLARLTVPAPEAVAPAAGYRHVDRDVYRFSRQGARTKAVVDGQERTVLKRETDCRDLLLPASAKLQVGYGVDRERLRAAGRESRPPEFAVRLRPEGAGEDVELLRETVGLDGTSWRQRTLPLESYGLQTVQLCVEIDGGAAGASQRGRFAFWEQPLILTPRDLARAGEAEDGDDDGAADQAPADLTPEELEVRRKHLKSLGYVG
ncbi:MAG TPA: arylsulfotransferase family protein [Thermoanaerobaculia bacterium]|nr:arylsulfotransferase family protein [Thermoanaerobaculia bacterium]